MHRCLPLDVFKCFDLDCESDDETTVTAAKTVGLLMLHFMQADLQGSRFRCLGVGTRIDMFLETFPKPSVGGRSAVVAPGSGPRTPTSEARISEAPMTQPGPEDGLPSYEEAMAGNAISFQSSMYSFSA